MSVLVAASVIRYRNNWAAPLRYCGRSSRIEREKRINISDCFEYLEQPD
jgi:hypothetical protein